MSRRHFLKHVSAGAAWAGSAAHFFTALQAEADRTFWIELRRACLTVARAIEMRYNLRDRK